MHARMNISILGKFTQRLKVFAKRSRTKFKERIRRFNHGLAKRKREREARDAPPTKFKVVMLWLFEALIAGLGINFVLWQLAGFQISIVKVIAWAVVYYFVTSEIPQFFFDCRRGVKK